MLNTYHEYAFKVILNYILKLKFARPNNIQTTKDTFNFMIEIRVLINNQAYILINFKHYTYNYILSF